MKATISARLRMNNRYAWVVLMVALAAGYAYWWPAGISAAETSLLEGRVTSPSGEALAGFPVRARGENSTMTVSVYTNRRGEYSYPGWSDLSPGSHSVAIELADFEPVRREAVMLSAGKAARVDFTLQPRKPSLSDATAAEIVAALPGTDDQKHLLIQCDNCHSLQWALRTPRTKEEWVQIVRRMAGERNASLDTPGTRAFGQKQYVEPLADYLVSIRGPGSSDEIPFRLRPRPTSEASTRLVVTEYDIPRGGTWDLYRIRGDRRAVWPHDVLVDAKSPYVWYTDHFSNAIGRLDPKTGETKEFAYNTLAGMGREGGMGADGRPGNPAGGAHTIVYDQEGNLVIGTGGGTILFNLSTEKFKVWPGGASQFGMDPADKVWYLDKTGLRKLDLTSGETKLYPLSPETDDDTYGMDTDSQGRSILNLWRLGKIGIFDPKTEKFTEYPTPTPGSGPRRGELDAKGRLWVGLYWAGRLAMFDPSNGEVKEFPLIPDTKPFGAPFPSPYTASVDDKNQLVWANDFNSGRIFSLDMRTGKSTEYFMPAPYEVRDLMVDKSAERPTMWIPAYRPPSKMVKVQVR